MAARTSKDAASTRDQTAFSDAICEALCKRLHDIRWSRNISQAELDAEAGVTRSTLSRIATGKCISLDSFVRVMQALRGCDERI